MQVQVRLEATQQLMFVALIIIQKKVSGSIRLESDIKGIAELVIDLVGQHLIAVYISCVVVSVNLHEIEGVHVCGHCGVRSRDDGVIVSSVYVFAGV